MKILMVNKFLYPNGGSETYIFQLGEELQKRGHEVQYFGMEHEGRIVGNRIDCYTSDMDFHTGKLQKLLYPSKLSIPLRRSAGWAECFRICILMWCTSITSISS